MKIEEFKQLTNAEPVVLHTDNERRGKKNRRLTIAATVVNNKLFIARTICNGDVDQFERNKGVSHALGRLISALTHFQNHTFAKVTERYKGLVEVIDYEKGYNRKEVLQCIEYIK